MARPEDEIVLHVSVAAWWSLRHLPYATEAERFLFEEIGTDRVRVLTVAGIELRVLDAIARDLSAIELDPLIAQLLYDDVTAQFQTMTRIGMMRVADPVPLAGAAFVMATRFGISLDDAMSMVLARLSDTPILLADEELRERLETRAAEHPSLQVRLHPDYWTA